jgi:hypothetical protein
MRHQLLRSADAGAARPSSSKCGLDALAVVTRAVALPLVQPVMATGTQGDPIVLGITLAFSPHQEVMVLQVVLRPTGNAEL